MRLGTRVAVVGRGAPSRGANGATVVAGRDAGRASGLALTSGLSATNGFVSGRSVVVCGRRGASAGLSVILPGSRPIGLLAGASVWLGRYRLAAAPGRRLVLAGFDAGAPTTLPPVVGRPMLPPVLALPPTGREIVLPAPLPPPTGREIVPVLGREFVPPGVLLPPTGREIVPLLGREIVPPALLPPPLGRATVPAVLLLPPPTGRVIEPPPDVFAAPPFGRVDHVDVPAPEGRVGLGLAGRPTGAEGVALGRLPGPWSDGRWLVGALPAEGRELGACGW